MRSGRYGVTRDRGSPLSPVAKRLCAAAGHAIPQCDVACLSCWGEAIRRDERIRIEEGLPAEHGDDASLVDDVAVDRFCTAEAGAPRFRDLNHAERVVAVTRLINQGWTSYQVQQHLSMAGTTWQRFVATLQAQTPALV